MKLKRCLSLVLVALSLNAHSLERDKQSHMAGFAAFSFVTYSFLKDTEHPVAYTVGIGTAAAVATEWYDKQKQGGSLSKGDVAADIAGSFIGAYIGKGFYYMNKQIVYKKEF